MKSSNYWQQFTNSGRIKDYLTYLDEEAAVSGDRSRQADKLGADPYAGIRMCNGDNTTTDAYRGI